MLHVCNRLIIHNCDPLQLQKKKKFKFILKTKDRNVEKEFTSRIDIPTGNITQSANIS